MKAKHVGIVTLLLIASAIGGGVLTAWLLFAQPGYGQQPPSRYWSAAQPYAPPPVAADAVAPPAVGIVRTKVVEFIDDNGKVRCSLRLDPKSPQGAEPRLLLTDENGKVLRVLSGPAQVYPASR